VIDERELTPHNIILDVCLIAKGLNYYFKKKVDLATEQTFSFNEKTYNIDEKCFFLDDPNIFVKTGRKIKRALTLQKIRRKRETPRYQAIYFLNQPDPIKAEGPPKTETREGETKAAHLTAEILKIAKESRALHKGIRELFTTPIGGKKLIFIVVVIGVIAAAVLILSGAIPIEVML